MRYVPMLNHSNALYILVRSQFRMTRHCQVQVIRTGEQYELSWSQEKKTRGWSVAHFRGKELSHESMRWTHVRDTFGNENRFPNQTQFEVVHGLIYQLKNTYKCGATTGFDILMAMFRKQIDHHSAELDPYFLLTLSRAADVAIRLTYGLRLSKLSSLHHKHRWMIGFTAQYDLHITNMCLKLLHSALTATCLLYGVYQFWLKPSDSWPLWFDLEIIVPKYFDVMLHYCTETCNFPFHS